MVEVCADDSGTYIGTTSHLGVGYLAYLRVYQSDGNPILSGRTTVKWRTNINIHDKAYYFVNYRGFWEDPELTFDGMDDTFYKYTVTARYVTGDPVNYPNNSILQIRDGNEPHSFTVQKYSCPNTGYLKGRPPPSSNYINYIEACVPPDRELPTLSGEEYNQGVYNAYSLVSGVSYIAAITLITKDVNNVAYDVEIYWRSSIKISDYAWSFSNITGTWVNPQLTELGYDPGNYFYKYKINVDEIKDWDIGNLTARLDIVDGSNHTFRQIRWSNYETTNYKTVTHENQHIEGYKVGSIKGGSSALSIFAKMLGG